MTEPTVDADAFNAFEAAGWEHQVAGYDAFFVPITTRLVGPLLDAGPGHVAAGAAERGASVIGVDIAEGMLSLARRLHPELEFRRGDAEALPFPDGSFDAVVANFVMLHVGRPEQAVAEFARVLAAEGRVALTVWDVPEHARFIGVLVEAVGAAGAGAPQDIPAGPPIFRFSDDPEFAGLLRDRGLEEVQVSTIAFSLRESSPDALWRGLLGGTVRVSALIRGQTDEMQGRIRAAFDRGVQPYEVADGLELPVSVKLASGRKPARRQGADRIEPQPARAPRPLT
jgi:SAM-dependent methyltransferase